MLYIITHATSVEIIEKRAALPVVSDGLTSSDESKQKKMGAYFNYITTTVLDLSKY